MRKIKKNKRVAKTKPVLEEKHTGFYQKITHLSKAHKASVYITTKRLNLTTGKFDD